MVIRRGYAQGGGLGGGPRGIRIPVSALRGPRPRPLDDGAGLRDPFGVYQSGPAGSNLRATPPLGPARGRLASRSPRMSTEIIDPKTGKAIRLTSYAACAG